MIPVTSAIAPFTVAGDEIFASSEVKSSIPPVFSSSAMSVVIPVTMTTIPSGNRLKAATSSHTRSKISNAAATNAESPIGSLKNTAPTIHAAIIASVMIWARVNGCCFSALWSAPASPIPVRSRRKISSPAANTSVCARKFTAKTRHSWP